MNTHRRRDPAESPFPSQPAVTPPHLGTTQPSLGIRAGGLGDRARRGLGVRKQFPSRVFSLSALFRQGHRVPQALGSWRCFAWKWGQGVSAMLGRAGTPGTPIRVVWGHTWRGPDLPGAGVCSVPITSLIATSRPLKMHQCLRGKNFRRSGKFITLSSLIRRKGVFFPPICLKQRQKEVISAW